MASRRAGEPVAVGSAWALVIVGGLALACGGDGGGQGVVCGDTRCAAGQVCCVDCDGHGSCGAPGSACPGNACRIDGGSPLPCAGASCAPNMICCIDCNSQGTCGAPGSVCPGVACLPDAGARFPCAGITCEVGQTCCGSCAAPFCGPPGSDCATPTDCPDAGPCGAADQTCCAGLTCTGSLMCCSGVPYPPGGVCGTSCGAVSDRDLKERVAPADPAEVLDRLASVPISTWSYRDDPTVRHLGPMAQDFHAAFGLGASDRRIDFVDANGVTMAAIQALRREVGALREDTAALRRQNAGLQREVDALRGGTDQCVAP